MFPLGLLTSGERAEVMSDVPGEGRLHPGGCTGCGRHGRGSSLHRAEEIGIRAGKVVEMLSNEGRGALLVKVDESRIAVGRGVAMKILVRRTYDESR